MRIHKSLSGLLVSVMLALSLPAGAQIAQPQIQYRFQGDLLANSGALTIASNATLVVTNSGSAIIKQGRGIALYPVMAGTAATTANTILQFGVSPGTNSTPTNPFNGPTNGPGSTLVFTNISLLFTNALTGTNPIQPYILIPATTLDNGGNLQLVTAQSQATNATGTTLSHIYWTVLSQ